VLKREDKCERKRIKQEFEFKVNRESPLHQARMNRGNVELEENK